MGALAGNAVTRLAVRALSVLAFIVMLVALLLLAKTTQNTEQFNRLHYVIVLLNAAGILMLLGLIVVNMVRLARDAQLRGVERFHLAMRGFPRSARFLAPCATNRGRACIAGGLIQIGFDAQAHASRIGALPLEADRGTAAYGQ